VVGSPSSTLGAAGRNPAAQRLRQTQAPRTPPSASASSRTTDRLRRPGAHSFHLRTSPRSGGPSGAPLVGPCRDRASPAVAPHLVTPAPQDVTRTVSGERPGKPGTSPGPSRTVWSRDPAGASARPAIPLHQRTSRRSTCSSPTWSQCFTCGSRLERPIGDHARGRRHAPVATGWRPPCRRAAITFDQGRHFQPLRPAPRSRRTFEPRRRFAYHPRPPPARASPTPRRARHFWIDCAPRPSHRPERGAMRGRGPSCPAKDGGGASHASLRATSNGALPSIASGSTAEAPPALAEIPCHPAPHHPPTQLQAPAPPHRGPTSSPAASRQLEMRQDQLQRPGRTTHSSFRFPPERFPQIWRPASLPEITAALHPPRTEACWTLFRHSPWPVFHVKPEAPPALAEMTCRSAPHHSPYPAAGASAAAPGALTLKLARRIPPAGNAPGPAPKAR
jgi:hypothetical protein